MRTLDLFKHVHIGSLGRERGDAAPLILGMVVLLSLTQLTGMALGVFDISLGRYLNLTRDGLLKLEVWRLFTFPLSTFAPPAGVGERASLLASLLIYCCSMAAFLSGGFAVEQRLGWKRTLGLTVVVMAMQAAFTIVVFASGNTGSEFNTAYSPAAVALAFLCFSQLVEFERNHPRGESDVDMRLVITAFLVLTVSAAAAFHPAFKPMLVGLVVGPLVAMCLFAANRKAERQIVERKGFGDVGALYYADDMELLTAEEMRQRTDQLLAQIAVSGMGSLSGEQRRFLTQASARLRALQMGHKQTSGKTGRD